MSRQDLLNQLNRQLRFLEGSCWLYDHGLRDEGIRIATVIRVLIHDTRKSTSLLQHLDSKDVEILDTCHGRPTDGRVFHGLGCYCLTPGGQTLMPNYNWNPESCFRPVSQWWGTAVCDVGEHSLKRKDIALEAANTDGGAHVDLVRRAEYENLAADGFIHKGTEDQPPIVDAHLVALRQMGYELLNSPQLVALAELATAPPYRVPDPQFGQAFRMRHPSKDPP